MKSILALCIAFVLIACACAFDCYVCTGCTGTGIATPCASKVKQCSRSVAKADGTISRSCGAANVTVSTVCTTTTIDGSSVEKCVCDTELCNEAGKLRGGTILSTLIFVVLAKILM